MAITSKIYGENGVKVIYEGAVLEVFGEDYRVMSDIWTMATFARVWSDEKGSSVRVLVNANFELDTSEGHAEVDATPERVALYAAEVAAREEALDNRRQAEARSRRIQEHNRPDMGKTMVVHRGRTHKGEIGIVFWLRDGRVGLRTSDAKSGPGWQDVIWVNAANLRNIEEFQDA
jgi:hypothetical protein